MTLLINPNNLLSLYFNKREKKKPRDVRCGGIILNKNLDSVLIVLNRDSLSKGEPKWGLPKGHINKNELLHHCAKREIEEETGLNINISNGSPRVKINDTYYYLVIIDNPGPFFPKDKKEIALVQWHKIENLQKINRNRGLKKMEKITHKIFRLLNNKFKNYQNKKTLTI
jgi:8-oxo-dGTP pyrophosphatase MutT (NUDIX family)